jgi:ribosome maturation protein Sdo1
VTDTIKQISIELSPPVSGAPVSATPVSAAQEQLSLSVVYVDKLAQKAANATRGLREGQIRFVRGDFRVKG